MGRANNTVPGLFALFLIGGSFPPRERRRGQSARRNGGNSHGLETQPAPLRQAWKRLLAMRALELPAPLRGFLVTTNAIENLIGSEIYLQLKPFVFLHLDSLDERGGLASAGHSLNGGIAGPRDDPIEDRPLMFRPIDRKQCTVHAILHRTGRIAFATCSGCTGLPSLFTPIQYN
jgi:hypothetical protein